MRRVTVLAAAAFAVLGLVWWWRQRPVDWSVGPWEEPEDGYPVMLPV